jgi:hypothetical protein
MLIIIAGVVDNDRQQKSLVGHDQVRPVDGELPLEPEIPLRSRVGIARDHGNEQCAVFYLPADRLIPCIPAA